MSTHITHCMLCNSSCRGTFELRRWQAFGHHSQTLQTWAGFHWPYAWQCFPVRCMSCCKAPCDQSDCSTTSCLQAAQGQPTDPQHPVERRPGQPQTEQVQGICSALSRMLLGLPWGQWSGQITIFAIFSYLYTIVIIDMDSEETIDMDQEGTPSTTCCFCVFSPPEQNDADQSVPSHALL